MQCPQCKTELMAGSLFCHKCGERIEPLDSAVARQAPPGEADSSAATQQAAAAPSAAETPMEKFKEAAASRMDIPEEAETELWRGGYSSRAMIGNWIASGLIGLGLIIVATVWLHGHPFWFWLFFLLAFCPGLYSLSVLIYRKMSVHYLLTNQRFIHESGFLRRVTNRIEVLDMDDISFEQGLVERLMGVGAIRIHSSDISHPELILRGIENVAEISNLIDNTRRTERRKRGLHIENI